MDRSLQVGKGHEDIVSHVNAHHKKKELRVGIVGYFLGLQAHK